jgi:hypothetical protein
MLRCPDQPELRRTLPHLDRWTMHRATTLQRRALQTCRTLRVSALVAFPGTRTPFEERHSRTASRVITDPTAPSSFTL